MQIHSEVAKLVPTRFTKPRVQIQAPWIRHFSLVQSYLLNFYYVHRVKICPLNLNFSSDFDRTNWVEFSPQDFPLSTGSYSATAIIHKVFEIGSSFQGK